MLAICYSSESLACNGKLNKEVHFLQFYILLNGPIKVYNANLCCERIRIKMKHMFLYTILNEILCYTTVDNVADSIHVAHWLQYIYICRSGATLSDKIHLKKSLSFGIWYRINTLKMH